MSSTLKLVSSLGMNRVQQDITFVNEGAGAVALFTVTGDVQVRIIPVVTTSLTSAADAYLELGIVGDVDAMILTSQATELDAREFWIDQNPDSEIEPGDVIRDYLISDGNNIILTLDAQVDTGAIRFYCFWTPISTDGNVVAA